MKKKNDIYIHLDETHNPDSAKEIVPLLVRLFQPNSVVDVGCGLGEWLHVFKDAGIQQILGLNGPWLNKEKLYISPSDLQEVDLNQPLNIDKHFDLTLCLEVAEHLPESAANTLVESLVSLGDTIIFSAAIPGQGGQNHLNEQWPDYWAKKFASHGYHFYDLLRPQIWEHTKIQWWYQQNMFVVSNQKMDMEPSHLALVHPRLFSYLSQQHDKTQNGLLGLRHAIRIFINSLKHFIKGNE